MLTKEEITNALTEAVRTSISIVERGRNTYQIISPFEFEDGDEIVAYIELFDDVVRLTDKGHTLMHVSYDVELSSMTRKKIVERTLTNLGLTLDSGVILTDVKASDLGYGFWDFVQGILKVSDVSQWKVERAASLFLEEFENFIEEKIRPEVATVEKDWFDPGVDAQRLYLIPWFCRNGGPPLFVFPINNNDHCSQAVISCLKYKETKYPFESLAVFREIDGITPKLRNQCLDTVIKPYTNFEKSIRPEVEEYILSRVHKA